MRSTMRRAVLLGVLVVTLVLTASGCDWAQFGFNAGNTRSTTDAGVATSTLPALATTFTAPTGGPIYSSPAVASGVAYVTSDDGRLYAFPATTGAGCSGSPDTCQPLWTATIEPAGAIGASGTVSSSPAVSGGVVFVGTTGGALDAFDVTGTTNCSGSPRVCSPLWTGTTGGSILSSPLVSGGVVYVGSTDHQLYAFDQSGVTGCVAAVCAPLWTGATGGAIDDSPTVVGSTAYVGSTDGSLYAFSATGTTGCVGAPVACSPLWTAPTGSAITFSSPAVSGGVAFVGSTGGVLSAFDAAGSIGCSGSPVVCAPLWTASTGGAIVASPAVAANVVYIGSSDHRLYALDATGATGCSGSPKVCTPLWTATTGGVIRSSAAVANKMVFLGSDDHQLYAYDATGTTDCSGSPTVCTPLWSATTGAEVASSPAVANGVVYVGSRDDDLYAYQPWVFARPVCPTNPHAPGLSPCQLQDAYELPSQVAGNGRTVAIVDAYNDPNAESDMAVYRSAYGLPACTTANGCFSKLNQSGVAGSYPTASASWSEEISLDLDTVSAICPHCHILLVEAKSPSLANLATAEGVAAGKAPTAISNSWGSPEFTGESSDDTKFSHAGLVTTFSTGDTGYGTSYPSSSPDVVAVGGTQLATNSSARGWTETAWSGAQSGCSSQEAKPGWQTDSGCANRTTADVSALAGSPGETIYDSYGSDTGWEDFGGTSLASPIIASVYALAYPDSSITTLYASTSSLFDVTSGSNGSCSGSYLCTAGVGYDGPTGLGTPCGTAAFGAGPFATTSCATTAAPSLAEPATAGVPAVVFTPSCAVAQPGYARCDAQKITASPGA